MYPSQQCYQPEWRKIHNLKHTAKPAQSNCVQENINLYAFAMVLHNAICSNAGVSQRLAKQVLTKML